MSSAWRLDEMAEALDALGRADQAAGAADVDLALLAHRVRAAFGACVGEDVRRALLLRRQILQHLRDDVAGALDADAVADADAEPGDLVGIVQGGVGDGDAADADRLQPRHRGQLAGAADLDVDRLEHRFGFLGREFVGERPARRLGDEAEPLLPVEPVDLVDDAVDVERKIGALGLDRPVMGDQARRSR